MLLAHVATRDGGDGGRGFRGQSVNMEQPI